MKKEIAFAATAAAALLGVPAFAADTAPQSVNISGTMDEVCTLGAPTGASAVNNAALNNNTITVAQLASPVDASLLASSITVQLPVMCNNAFKMQISDSVSGLKQTQPVSVVGGEFTTKIGYQVSGQFPGGAVGGTALGVVTQTVANNAPDAPYTAEAGVSNPVKANYRLTVAIPADSRPVIAGQYSGQIRVTASSNF